MLLSIPVLFLVDRPLDIAASLLVAIACWLLVARASSPLRSMRSFIWLLPGLVLLNGLVGPQPKLWGLLSRSGLLAGMLVGYRFAWAGWMALVLIRSCPTEELLASLRAILRFLHIRDRSLSLTITLTIELLPQFADIRVSDFRNLPDAITRRLAPYAESFTSEATADCSDSVTAHQGNRAAPSLADIVLIGTLLVLVVVAALV